MKIDTVKLLGDFNRNVGGFFARTNLQRQEIYRAYEYRDGQHFTAEEAQERKKRDKAVITVNLCAPIVRAVAGTQCMQDSKIDIFSTDPEFDDEMDIMADGVEYVQYASGEKSERRIAKEDTATCGIGGTVTYLDFSHKKYIAGHPICERIFPGFLYYDNSSRGSRLNASMRWCGYADPVLVEDLDEKLEKSDAPKENAMVGGDFKAFLMSFSAAQNYDQIDFIYHYFWWEWEDIYDVANPFLGEGSPVAGLIQSDDDVANLIGEAAEKLMIDWQAAYWTFSEEDYKTFRETLEAVRNITGEDVPPPSFSKRKGKCYYRAQIARGQVIESGRSYRQDGHPLNLIPGYFDERNGIQYGLMRPLSEIQDALNITTSDFLSYAKSAAHGGSAYIKGAGEAIERIKKEKANEDSLTPLPSGAEIIPKALAATPEVLISFIRLMMEVMPRVVGVGEEFLGIVTSGDMTDSLYGKLMKQSYNVLANLANNSAESDKAQAEIDMALVRLMAEANDGMIFPVLSPGKAGDQYKRLTKQSLAREYAVRIAERPMTADERQDTFNKLGQLVPQLMQSGVNIIPQWLKYAPVDKDDRDEMVKAATPQPQQPDPLNQELLKSQVRLGNAQASKWEAEAQGTTATLGYQDEKIGSEINKNNATAIKTMMDAGRNVNLPMVQ